MNFWEAVKMSLPIVWERAKKLPAELMGIETETRSDTQKKVEESPEETPRESENNAVWATFIIFSLLILIIRR